MGPQPCGCTSRRGVPRQSVTTRMSSLVGDFYTLLALLGVSAWDTTDERPQPARHDRPVHNGRSADYESVTRRSRRDPTNPGEQVGGQIGGEWFYRNLALLLVNYANGNYDDFDGEEDLLADGVALGTVHGAKGLEWPVVFLPSLTDGRLPVEQDRAGPGLARAARPVRRRPLRGLRRRRAAAVLRRAHPRPRLGVAVLAPQGRPRRRGAAVAVPHRVPDATSTPAPAIPTRRRRERHRDARPRGHLQRARRRTSTARRATCCATSSASCRRSRPSSATATPCTT